MTPGRRLALVLLAGLVPWLVVIDPAAGTTSLVLSFGFVSLDPLSVTPIWHYLPAVTGGLADSLGMWPVATLLYVLAIDCAVIGWQFGREDRRLTAGLLVGAGISLLPVGFAASRPAGVTAIALGATVLWLVAWLGYRDALKQAVLGIGRTDGR